MLFYKKDTLTKTVVQFWPPVPLWMLLRKRYFDFVIEVFLLTKSNIDIKSACKAEAKKQSPTKSNPNKLRTIFHFHCLQVSSVKGTYWVAYVSWGATWAFFVLSHPVHGKLNFLSIIAISHFFICRIFKTVKNCLVGLCHNILCQSFSK